MLEKKLLQTILEKKLILPGDQLLLAVSGGQDSVMMTHLFHRLAKTLKIKLHLAHFNHQLRGRQSKLDEKFVRNLAEKLKIPAHFGRANVKNFAKKNKLSQEAAGRFLRYEFLKKISQKIDGAKIATAHTADDQVETFFLRLLRGAGLAGLRGILPSRQDKIIRPMLNIWRSDIEKFIKKNKLKFRQDQTNFQTKFLRNKLRLKILPLLEAINPAFKKLLFQNLTFIGEENDWLEKLTAAEIKKTTSCLGRELKINLAKFKLLARPLQRRIFKKILGELVPAEKEIFGSHIETVLARLGGRGLWQLHLPGPVFVFPENDFLIFSRRQPEPIKKNVFKYKVFLGRKKNIPEIKKTVFLKLVKNSPSLKKIKKEAPHILYLDFQKTGKELFIRSRLPGDRFQPLGQSRPGKLKNFLINRKIPAVQKDLFPLLVNKRDKIVAVIGAEISDDFKITPPAKKILKMSISAGGPRLRGWGS